MDCPDLGTLFPCDWVLQESTPKAWKQASGAIWGVRPPGLQASASGLRPPALSLPPNASPPPNPKKILAEFFWDSRPPCSPRRVWSPVSEVLLFFFVKSENKPSSQPLVSLTLRGGLKYVYLVALVQVGHLTNVAFGVTLGVQFGSYFRLTARPEPTIQAHRKE